LNKETCLVYLFLNAVQGNWRNAVYIECGNTVCNKSCRAFLLAFDWDGKAVLFPVSIMEKLIGQTVDKSECSTVIPLEKFKSLFGLWLSWLLDSENECPAFAFMHTCECHKTGSCLLI